MKDMDKTTPELTSKDVLRVELDGKKIKTVKSFYTKIAKSLHFPDYFNHNLDSLDELLCDLEWIEQKKVQLVIQHSQDFCGKENGNKKESLLDVLNNAVDNQMDESRSFELILS